MAVENSFKDSHQANGVLDNNAGFYYCWMLWLD